MRNLLNKSLDIQNIAQNNSHKICINFGTNLVVGTENMPREREKEGREIVLLNTNSFTNKFN